MRVKRVMLWVGVILGVVAVVALGVVAYVVFGLSRPGEVSARYLPAYTPIYASLNLRPGVGQLNNARKVLPRLESEAGREARDELLEEAEDETGIHFLDDVTPWLGTEIAVAVLDPDLSDPEWVAMLQISDQDAAADFVDDLVDYFGDDLEVDFDEVEENGTRIWETSDQPVAIGLTETHLLMADSKRTVEDIAENIQNPPENALIHDESFVRAQAMLPEGRFLFAYIVVEDTWDALQDEFDQDDIDDDIMRQLEQALPHFIGISSSFVADGVRFDLAYEPEDGILIFDDDVDALTVHEVLPAETVLAIASVGIDKAIDELIHSDRVIEDAYDELRASIDDEIGIDIENDLLDNLSGEFAVAMLPSDLDRLDTDNFNWILELLLLAGVTDSDRIEDTLDDLMRSIAREADLDIDRWQLGEYEAVVIPIEDSSLFDGDYQPGYFVAEEWAVIASTEDSLDTLHDTLTGEAESLGSSDKIKELVDLLPQPLHSLAYLDVQALLRMIEDALPSETLDTYRDFESYVETLDVLLIVSSMTEEAVLTTMILTVQ